MRNIRVGATQLVPIQVGFDSSRVRFKKQTLERPL